MRCAWLLAGALFLLAGCGQGDGYSKLNLVEVTGKVTLDGAPLANARVRFEASDGTGAEGITDASGNYRLMHDSEHAGCTPGAKTVRVTSGAALEEGADPETAAASEKIPAAYNSQSTLKADVSESNKTFDFDLKSKS